MRRRHQTINDFEEWLERSASARFVRREAFSQAGNWAALHDAICQAVATAENDADDELSPDATIPVPYWVFEPLIHRILRPFLEDTRPRGAKGRGGSKWIKRYEQDLIDWRRFMFVWYRAIGVRYDCDVLQPEEARRLRKLIHRESRKVGSRDEIATGVPYPWNQTSDPEDLSVFEAVEKQLRGTPYAAGVKGIKKSYEKVTAALKTGRAGRYYPSKFIAFKGHARSAEAEQPR